MSDYTLVPDLYDYVVPCRDRADVSFFVDAARESGGPVLEVGCGTGRVLIPTARAGVDIAGLDRSPRMLDVCRRKVREESAVVQSRVELVEADMRDFAVPHRFVLATVPFRPFQHLITTDDQLACLACIHRHLVAGGRLILDLYNPSLDLLANRPLNEELGEEPEFVAPDGRRVVRTHRTVGHDRANQCTQVELIYNITHPDGRKERLVDAFPFRYLFRFEAEHLLARAGFELEHLYSGYDKRAFGSSYPGELLFVARKADNDHRRAR